ncbi:hypothetical protein FB45DRAFT_1084206 [Roridomyces roridus]|uniref:Uncharacterized protein n=1 Tax=Roridomyces roridus TaxID=1738132 RepID=A0AAD7BN91_9AGAR|nr:hypothetical protein FB45DRAFT_1084206 [Roridomyces roridus]
MPVLTLTSISQVDELTLATTSTANKAHKPVDGTFQPDPDRNTSPRETPKQRKGNRTRHPAIFPLSFAEIATGSSYDFDTSDDSGDDTEREPASPTENPHRSPSPPPAPDSDYEMSDVNMPPAPPVVPAPPPGPAPAIPAPPPPPAPPAPAPAPAPAPIPQQPALVNPQPNNLPFANPANAQPPPPAPAAQPPAPVQFAMPSVAELAAVIPAAKANNPHLRFQPAQPAPHPAPIINPGQPQIKVQHNRGFFPNVVVPNSILKRDVGVTQWDTIAGGNNAMALLMADGGNQLMATELPVPMQDRLRGAIRTVAARGPIEINLAVRSDPVTTHGKYGGPVIAFVEVDDNGDAAAILAQCTFAVDNALAFWAISIHANRNTVSWCFAYYRMAHAGGNVLQILALVRGHIIHVAFRNMAIYHQLDRITQGRVGDADSRVFGVLNTVHFDMIQRDGVWVVAGYMEPPTNDELELQALYALFRPLKLHAGKWSFEPMTRENQDECVLCKGSDHPSFMCPYSNPELVWWGPPGQIKELPSDNPIVANSTFVNHEPAATRGGRGRGNGRGGHGGHAGRNGRGGRGGRGARGGRGH